jgi:hypothetical protein
MGLSVVSSFQNLGTRAENWACLSPERLHEQHPMSIQYPLLGLCHFARHPLGESTGRPLCLCVSSTRDRKTGSDFALEARKRWGPFADTSRQKPVPWQTPKFHRHRSSQPTTCIKQKRKWGAVCILPRGGHLREQKLCGASSIRPAWE